MSIGSKIREYRLKRGYTQSQLAEKLKMTEANISSYERDKSIPPSERLSQIASILNVSTDYLLGSSEDPTPGLRQYVINPFTGETDLLSEYETEIQSEIDKKVYTIRSIKDHISSVENDNTIGNSEKNTLVNALNDSIDKINNEIDQLIVKKKESYPEWATKKDISDFKKMLEDDQPVMFDGVPIEGEKRQRVMDILSGLFWEAKELNKKTYGRKKDNTNNTSDDNKE